MVINNEVGMWSEQINDVPCECSYSSEEWDYFRGRKSFTEVRLDVL